MLLHALNTALTRDTLLQALPMEEDAGVEVRYGISMSKGQKRKGENEYVVVDTMKIFPL